ncbi:hypothetical protein ACI6PS_02475 [Flavobacterium sp. PLA-1-15]|uniref:hypothetical protein n=1 Tax=Flavobacterium sp. PLA-1-15 TaxID=3380533 RepID=UPI003B7FB9CD
MNIVPVKIRQHLIPFFLKEFEGVDGQYLNMKVKACKITAESSLGFMLLTSLQKTENPIKPDKYYVYITFSDTQTEAKIYKVEKGRNHFLRVPEEVNIKINNLIEDQFRIAFVFHTRGMLKASPDLLVRDAISEFMVEYELDESGFDLESLRRILNRGDKFKMSRLQNKISNRVFGY